MKIVHGLASVAVVAVLPAVLLPVAAQELTCNDVEFDAAATAEFPSIAHICQSIVVRDGKPYIRLVADVVSAKSDGTIMLDFKTQDGSRIRQTLTPPQGFRAMISGVPTPARKLRRGQEIRLYLPAGHWHAIDTEDEGAQR